MWVKIVCLGPEPACGPWCPDKKQMNKALPSKSLTPSIRGYENVDKYCRTQLLEALALLDTFDAVGERSG
jgi:hypothetical protein